MKKRILMYGLAAIVCVLWAAATGSAAGPGTIDYRGLEPEVESGIGPAPVYNHTGRGADFIKAGVTTRVYNSLGAPSQTDPFILTVPALPAGAVSVETFISWNYLLNGVPPATDSITVNGVPVVGNLCGSGSPDLCWGKDGAATYKASGVTAAVGPGPAPVAVTIAGATDKSLGADPGAYGEGLTILVVYDVPGPNCRSVDVWCGYTSNLSGGGATSATLTYTHPYGGGSFHFFTNALDGQIASDDFFIDGILRSGAVAGTVVAGDAWQGLLGVPPGPPGIDYLYDHANDDISVLVPPPGPLGLTFGTNMLSDCIGHSFAAISFPVDEALCQPRIPTLTEWGLIIFCVLLFGWMAWVIVRRRRRVTISA
jgi:hypothetical protein